MELRTLTKEELDETVKKHGLWIKSKDGRERANLSGANLEGANLSRANLEGAYLYNAKLSRAYLEGAYLYNAKLSGANLEGANLTGAYLTGAYLYNANLEGANLEGANLEGANLEGANLEGANLEGANLSRANLYGANLTGAKGKVLAIGPIGSRNGITYAFWSENDKSIHIQCGCFSGTFDEWKIKCVETHEDSIHGRAYAAAAEFIADFAVINNWEGKK